MLGKATLDGFIVDILSSRPVLSSARPAG